jgi:hypothetical protein
MGGGLHVLARVERMPFLFRQRTWQRLRSLGCRNILSRGHNNEELDQVSPACRAQPDVLGGMLAGLHESRQMGGGAGRARRGKVSAARGSVYCHRDL